ncbi:M61 family metallopeptidase [Chitinilyticum litopenaei]|uniref:M61 family metallopeptidase n=1 Tax=Chitinilyticum litopenaei TaxID=1121276 RepID=UPI000417B066|nr:PDZ domain-containing protein [Chitinilyticum litopenaei]
MAGAALAPLHLPRLIMIEYRISPLRPHAHLFEITLTIPQPAAAGQILALPVWIPGSYLVREFARNIVRIAASSAGASVALTKLDKQRWQAEPLPEGQGLTVVYEVYAYDLSVRGAYLDQYRGFFNGTSVFLAVAGQEDRPCRMRIDLPAELAHWRVAGGLPAADAAWQADNYDVLIDHPFELGEFREFWFEAGNRAHRFVIAGRHQLDEARLRSDVQRICDCQIGFWGDAPFADYHFLTFAVGDGYGGLEHRNSTALLCSRNDLPLPHETSRKQAYRQFLGLVSHEYFHTWLVKRIKPAEFVPYRLDGENYTRQLWLFEGVTSYYDDLLLLRCGLISVAEYLEVLSQTITGVQRNPGSAVQNLEEASLDAWVKYYRQDENSPNALVSYYTKGALVALCTDLLIRRHSGGVYSLDDVMRELWQRFGKTGVGVPVGEFEAIATRLAGVALDDFFARALRGTQPLPLRELLEEQGLQWQQRAAVSARDKGGWLDSPPPSRLELGCRWQPVAEGLKLTHVLSDSPAERAGLAAGDVIVAINGLRASAELLEGLLLADVAAACLALHLFRRDELLCLSAHPGATVADTIGLRLPGDDVPAIFRPV